MGEEPRDWEQDLRRWALRPPRVSASRAAGQVVQRIGPRRAQSRSLRRVLAATVMVAAALGLWLVGRPAPPPVPPGVAPLPENVVQWWLDADTPVYFVVGPPRSRTGGRP